MKTGGDVRKAREGKKKLSQEVAKRQPGKKKRKIKKKKKRCTCEF